MYHAQNLTPGDAAATLESARGELELARAQATGVSRQATLNAPTAEPSPTRTPQPTWTLEPTATAPASVTPQPVATVAATVTVAPTASATATAVVSGGTARGDVGAAGAILFVVLGAALLIGSTLFRRRR